MTIDAAIPLATFTVSGTGPYPVNWPYAAGTLAVSVLAPAGWTDLSASVYTVAPTSSDSTGAVTLAPSAAAEHAGRQLTIRRETPREQGWEGVANSREKGIERGLDQQVMTLQELTAWAERSLRVIGQAQPPLSPPDGAIIMFKDGKFVAGPDVAAILAAAIRPSTAGDTFPSDPRHGYLHHLTAGPIGMYQFYQPSDAAPGIWIEVTEGSSGDGALPPFATRADLVAWAAVFTPAVGTVLWAGGFAYRYVGTAGLPGLTGYTWAGTAHLEHWGVTTSAEKTDAVVDYTTQVQAAADAVEGTLIFTGWVKITDQIAVNSRCRLHCPEGRVYGGLVVAADFNLSAARVVVPGDSSVGGGIGELGIYCAQNAAAASGLRADLIQYPPVLLMEDVARVQIDALRIEQAWIGLKIDGNAGGLKVGTLEIGAFGAPFYIDGPLDFIHINNVHLWPFGGSSSVNLTALHGDGHAQSRILQADGLHIDNLSVWQQIVSFEGPDGGNIIPTTFGVVKLDGDNARWVHKTGTALIGQFYSTKSVNPLVSSIRVEDGLLVLGQGTVRGGETPQVNVVGGTLLWLGGELKNVSTDEPSVTVTAGTCLMQAVRLDWSGTRTVPLIDQSGTGRLILRDLIPEVTAPAQPLIRCATDVDGAMIDALSLAPHTIDLPTISGAPKGTYLSRSATVMRMPSYADNAAAVSGGLPIGALYRTATGEMRIVV